MTSATAYCPALFVTAPSSDSGKTTLVAAMARYWRNQGKKVRVFKSGPDFIDPIFHEFASGQPAYQLDLGMLGEDICKQHIYLAAKEADLIIIEGVMGMYDGINSSAALAMKFGIPLLAVINAAKMAQTFGAIAYGLANYNKDANLFGVIANFVGSPGHTQMLKDSLPAEIAFCGAMPRDPSLALPERHLGLIQANEIDGLDQWLDHVAQVLGENCALPLPEPIAFEAPQSACGDFLNNTPMAQPLAGKTIAVAKDAAFTFIYRDNITLLEQLGANIRYFSVLHDAALPKADSLYLPGGYPELHLTALSQNKAMQQSIIEHIHAQKPTLAECGGMLYLLEELTNKDTDSAQLTGAIPGKAVMQKRFQGLGMLTAKLGEHQLTGHCFHYSKSQVDLQTIAIATQAGKTQMQEPVFWHNNILASYVHWYFPSAPALIAALFNGQFDSIIEPSE
ncbi:cobyrinate a,c-diamide synthase [Shewanella intestini]|uniref:Cobyrinate a,c-diamide synthase n=1 Tax=Shewanella intestini TaxID=2017544 RepID=A0ABS5I1R2_9GAMM|nr:MULTISPECIES: cobyrinate a,c-diamide synthase [Shewanella]MBR9727944.1 cobyrinate a,c-diamide synthase [Shewanella intestini]MRG36505.1 cobyrinate a,c-diamide synthase [Shewanella sp. XMDDZSB0408]